MNLRAKLLLVFILLTLIPTLTFSLVNYVSGTRTIRRLLRAEATDRARVIAREIEEEVRAHEDGLRGLAASEALRAYLRTASASDTERGPNTPLPREVEAAFSDFFKDNHEHFVSLTCLGASGQPLFRAFEQKSGTGVGEVQFQTDNFVTSSLNNDRPISRASTAQPLHYPSAQEPYGTGLNSMLPVAADAQSGGALLGALVLEMNLERLFESADEGRLTVPAAGAARQETMWSGPLRHNVVALDNTTGQIVYHTNGAFRHLPATQAMPYFEAVAAQMKSGADGVDDYDSPEGDHWLAAYRQVPGLNTSVAVAENYTAASASLRNTHLTVLMLALITGAAALVLVNVIARRAALRIQRVARGAAAIAGGHLDQHIDLHTSDETRALAESFNLMNDRLRELIRREAESKQFESFTRLSAMLTHDLKNAITGLSMLVSNMEKQFHREEFRADAIWSLREATDKLRRLVLRLNEPVKSLSGEYRRDARQTDLVPIIRQVLTRTAEPSRPLYEIETHLPGELVATFEPERIENVIENLVINALEAMGTAGGRLTVEAGTEADDRIFFSVADTGTGMSEEFIRTRLFHPFATTKSKGIGLGLFTCREIVEAHGGRIDVESRPGAGTRFRVVLPSRLFISRS